ncbi:MAG: hypothetical protein RMJ53_10250, partial [Chitinophagales bacterium]|nr:hypothetical protein [Chitinophagales bacterium]
MPLNKCLVLLGTFDEEEWREFENYLEKTTLKNAVRNLTNKKLILGYRHLDKNHRTDFINFAERFICFKDASQSEKYISLARWALNKSSDKLFLHYFKNAEKNIKSLPFSVERAKL